LTDAHGHEGGTLLTAITGSEAARRSVHQGWEEVAEAYAADPLGLYDACARRLVDLIEPPPGAAVLDVGTGGGAAVVPLQQRVGPSGLVVGIDIARSMLRIAGRTAHSTATAPARVCQMDAERLGFADSSFDSVACAFSLFQFPDMRCALAEMRRTARPGGSVGLSNWGPGYFTPVAEMQRGLFREFGLRQILANPIAFKPDELKALLESAGLTSVELCVEQLDRSFADAQAVWDYNMSMGPFPIMLRQQLPPAQVRQLHERFLDMLNTIASPEGIRCTFHVLYSLARRPTH
jgi:ubiquinone/menaquinone biosynthesis C-methylase UbiE